VPHVSRFSRRGAFLDLGTVFADWRAVLSAIEIDRQLLT
jgi:hypothetical protein